MTPPPNVQGAARVADLGLPVIQPQADEIEARCGARGGPLTFVRLVEAV